MKHETLLLHAICFMLHEYGRFQPKADSPRAEARTDICSLANTLILTKPV